MTIRLAPDSGGSGTDTVTDTPSSGASPLPQGLGGVRESEAHRQHQDAAPDDHLPVTPPIKQGNAINVGGAVRRFDLPPMTVHQSQYLCLTHRHRGQAPSHMG